MLGTHLRLAIVDSGIIFPIIIGLWAAYLVPHWIRRRQQLSASRSVDRFSDAMRVLDRRDDAKAVARPQSHSYVLRPPRAPVQDLPPAPVVPSTPRPAARPAVRPGRRPRAALGMAVLVLLLATPVTGVLAVLGTAPGWVPVVALGLLLLAVGRLRALAVRRRSGRSSQPRVSRVAAAAPAAPAVAASAVAASASAVEEQVADDDVAAEPGSWTPVPVPVPTYMLKPMAPARRVAPWQEGPAAASAEPEPAPEPVVPAAEYEPAAYEPAPTRVVPDLDAVLERRRASGE